MHAYFDLILLQHPLCLIKLVWNVELRHYEDVLAVLIYLQRFPCSSDGSITYTVRLKDLLRVFGFFVGVWAAGQWQADYTCAQAVLPFQSELSLRQTVQIPRTPECTLHKQRFCCLDTIPRPTYVVCLHARNSEGLLWGDLCFYHLLSIFIDVCLFKIKCASGRWTCFFNILQLQASRT